MTTLTNLLWLWLYALPSALLGFTVASMLSAAALGIPLRGVTFGIGPDVAKWRVAGVEFKLAGLPLGATVLAGTNDDDPFAGIATARVTLFRLLGLLGIGVPAVLLLGLAPAGAAFAQASVALFTPFWSPLERAPELVAQAMAWPATAPIAAGIGQVSAALFAMNGWVTGPAMLTDWLPTRLAGVAMAAALIGPLIALGWLVACVALAMGYPSA